MVPGAWVSKGRSHCAWPPQAIGLDQMAHDKFIQDEKNYKIDEKTWQHHEILRVRAVGGISIVLSCVLIS